MNKQLNISVFGLKLTTIDELKLIIERLLPEKYSVNWTNINDASLDILLISHLFFDLPNIMAIRQRRGLKTLRVAHDPVVQSQVIQDTLYLPVETSAIKYWFEQNVLENHAQDNTTRPITNPFTRAAQHTKSITNQQESDQRVQDFLNKIQSNTVIEKDSITNRSTIKTQPPVNQPNTKPTPQLSYQQQIQQANQTLQTPDTSIKSAFVRAKSPLSEALFYDAIHYKHFENLQAKLWQNQEYRQCILVAGDIKIALIDKPNNQFWLANGLTTVSQSIIHLQHADLNNVVRFCHRNQPYDLQYGLWNFVWQNVGTIVPSYTGYYRLKHWPQPLQQKNQKDILKIAAYLQSGASLEYIHKDSGIALELIYRFVFASLVSDMIEAITEQNADPRFKITQSSETSSAPKSALSQFFGKLRKKLGL